MKIAFCASEVFPFAKTGGLADVAGTLPLALEKLGVEVAVFLPHYKNLELSGRKIKKVCPGVSQAKLGRTIKVYLIENKKLFGREGLYGNAKGDYPDNLERFAYFCGKVLETLKRINFKPEVVHCHDWHTALIPVLLKENYGHDPFFLKVKTLLTIHNLAYQGVFPRAHYPKLGLPKRLFTPKGFKLYGKINFLKAGIIFSNVVTTVSPQYAKEIRTKKYGCGLQRVLQNKGRHIQGVLNGLDYDIWNPQTDPYVKAKFGLSDLSQGKFKNKKNLQRYVRLPQEQNIPVYGFVGRLSHQKGIDLILGAADELLKKNVQVVIQGLGDSHYKAKLSQLARRYPQKLAVVFEFDEKLAHQIYAGSDMFLMPSLFEPCGLSQMISFAYGTMPIVFKTGGLADTVVAHKARNGNGFIFEKYNKKAFLQMIEASLRVFKDKRQLQRLRKNAFKCRFSWKKSAQEYKRIYQCLLSA